MPRATGSVGSEMGEERGQRRFVGVLEEVVHVVSARPGESPV